MNKLISLLKHNAATSWMLVFVLLFYSLMLFGGGSPKKEPAGEAVKKTERMTSRELKQREELFKKNLQAKPDLMAVVSLSLLAVLLTGLFLNIYFLVKKARGVPLISQSLSHGSVGWGLPEVFQVFVFLFFVEAVVLTLEISASVFFNLKSVEKDFFLMVNSLLRDIFVAGFVVILVKRRFGQPLSEIGLTTKHFFKNLKTGFVGYLAIIPSLFLLLFILAAIAQLFSYEPPPQPVVEMYLKESTEKYLIFFTFFVALVGPVIEEIFFRGFTYKAFRTRFGVKAAILASSAIFALLHMNFIAFVPIFFLGIFLAYLYEKTGSLVPSMTVHMLHNLIMVFLTLGFKSLSV